MGRRSSLTLRLLRIACFGAACTCAFGAVAVAALASAAPPQRASGPSTAGLEATAPAPIASDEFSGTALDSTLWRVLDPLGDSSVSVASGRLRISVAGAVRHDLWEAALEAPRVLQTVADVDFEVEAKYDAAVSQGRMQGLIAQAGVGDLVRFDMHAAAGATRLFAATFVAGRPTTRLMTSVKLSTPFYLRMKRAGSAWTLRYSSNGQSWTTAASFSFSLALNELGLFAGNFSSGSPPPAFTSQVDYFRVVSQSAPPPPPVDTTAPVISGVSASATATGATVSWSTDEPADSRVEYGLSAAYGLTRSEASLVGSHSLELIGLACETSYHYRVSSADAAGNGATGEDRTFTTSACPPPPPPMDTTAPVISGVSASAAATGATVSWSTDEPADSRVEYGLSASYGQTRSEASLVGSHSLELIGLACGTSYHYRVSSADAAGNRATAEDRSFSTGACPPPPSWVRGDEFDGSALDAAVWRLVDPLGDSSVSVGGGRLRVTLPAGSAHDLWEESMLAPRVLQAAGDGDFEIEAKFDSPVRLGYQSQGLVAQADFDDLVRVDVYSAGGEMRVFAATFVAGRATLRANAEIGGGAPVYLRLGRAGSLWTLRYSSTGSAWTTAASFSFPLALREFGLFAGNPITAPAFTAEVDYFRVLSEAAPPPPPPPPVDTTAPAIGGVNASATATGATVTWSTDEPADSRVEYGTTATYGETRSDPALVTSHAIALSGLTCETTYHFRVSSADAAGNRATAEDRTFTTSACPPPPPVDTTAPVISGLAVSAAATGATVSWSTDEPADSRVEYGPSTAYGQTRSQPTLTVSHSLELSGLDCATSYHYRVSSADAAGNRATGEDRTFSTGACQPPPPSWLRGDEFDGSTLDTSVWRVVDPLGDASVSVGTGRLRVSLPAGRAHDLWEGALHAPRVLGAAADADFEIEAKYDSAVSETYQSQGLVAQSDFDDFVRFDVYSSGGATRLFAATFVGGSATVRLQETIQGGAPIYLRMQRSGAVWTLRYSLTGSSWTTAASFNFPLALHEFGVFAGNPGPAPAFTAQVDHFRVLSEGQPPPPPPGDTTPPVLSGVAATPGATTATITWTTDEPADSRVEYGPTAAYGQTRSGSALVTSHSISLSGLTCATTYHYRVSSMDASGNRATGGDRTFTTGACVPSTGPEIEIWYGDSQRFGDPGIAQRWFNILGKAADSDGLARIDYRVDAGPRINLVFDTAGYYWRIGAHGDFNIELDRFALSPGQHVVTITASDALGNESTRSVNVEVVGGRTWPLPYETNWAAGLQRTAQIVDGRWALDGDGVRSIVPGYDRTIAIGDETWASVDATVPVTIHAFNASADHAGVGIAAGWRGHEGTESPRNEWPLGGLCFYYRHQPNEPYWLYLIQFGSPMFVGNDPRRNWLEPGTQYVFRIRAEPVDAQQSRYSCKVWQATEAEPLEWHVSALLPRRSGSLLLVSDHADVTFGRVSARSTGQ